MGAELRFKQLIWDQPAVMLTTRSYRQEGEEEELPVCDGLFSD